MISRLRAKWNTSKNKRAHRRARADAVAQGGVVCGTYRRNGEPVYFVAPKGVSDAAVQALAFEAREGRALEDGELILKAHTPALNRTWGSGIDFLADATARMKGTT